MTSIHSESFPRKVSILFHIVAMLPLAGFAVGHLFWGDLLLGLILLMALITVTLSLRQELRFRDSLLYRQWFVLVVSVAIVYACYSVGLRGLIYAFPMASVFFFTFRLSHGLITGIIFSISCLLAALNVEEPLLVVRFSVGITICMVFASIFAFIVGRQKAELERQAGLDELTGALNRRRLQETLDAALQLKQRHQTPASLILVDLDHFKSINDTHGHLVGDQVLIDFSRLVSGRIRSCDKLFRFGGEEFMILLPETTEQQASQLAESLRERIAQKTFGGSIHLTCSFGVAELQADETLEAWLQACDMALYQAKHRGRNRTVRRFQVSSEALA